MVPDAPTPLRRFACWPRSDGKDARPHRGLEADRAGTSDADAIAVPSVVLVAEDRRPVTDQARAEIQAFDRPQAAAGRLQDPVLLLDALGLVDEPPGLAERQAVVGQAVADGGLLALKGIAQRAGRGRRRDQGREHGCSDELEFHVSSPFPSMTTIGHRYRRDATSRAAVFPI